MILARIRHDATRYGEGEMAQRFPLHCTNCGAIVQPNERVCTACGFSASPEWTSWQAPLPDRPAPSTSPIHENPRDPYVPLQIPPDHSARDRRVRRTLALLILLVSGALLALSELLLRDGYDRLAWGIVWFASLGVMIMAILWWCREGTQALRRRRRRRS